MLHGRRQLRRVRGEGGKKQAYRVRNQESKLTWEVTVLMAGPKMVAVYVTQKQMACYHNYLSTPSTIHTYDGVSIL